MRNAFTTAAESDGAFCGQRKSTGDKHGLVLVRYIIECEGLGDRMGGDAQGWLGLGWCEGRGMWVGEV